jgi:hypothetical protein
VTTTDFDQLTMHTVVNEDGRIKPIGKRAAAKLAMDLADICREADDPQAALQAALEVLSDQMAEIGGQCSTAHLSPLRRLLTGVAGSQCLERRPGRDSMTGDRVDGLPDDKETWPDRLLCTQQHGHGGDHCDGLGRSWQREEASA